jgi:hypothetical protein
VDKTIIIGFTSHTKKVFPIDTVEKNGSQQRQKNVRQKNLSMKLSLDTYIYVRLQFCNFFAETKTSFFLRLLRLKWRVSGHLQHLNLQFDDGCHEFGNRSGCNTRTDGML